MPEVAVKYSSTGPKSVNFKKKNSRESAAKLFIKQVQQKQISLSIYPLLHLV